MKSIQKTQQKPTRHMAMSLLLYGINVILSGIHKFITDYEAVPLLQAVFEQGELVYEMDLMKSFRKLVPSVVS
ncbi:hypothetical protein [Paenibacillus sp. N3.4]|uniref:hypothetical protein n=1 Tax=Paenibacillus sp. N3.4 TaxID=2603222 RepID=UPI0011CB5CEC|nr:hypothetical protein [Paenibacillus sp. N3.4]TXK77979.1 hypothetical protein FU659_21575 [Paenibacillus sp. N3.4]